MIGTGEVHDGHLQALLPGELDHRARAGVLAVPEGDESIRHLCHFRVAYWSGRTSILSPIGGMNLTLQSVFLREPLAQGICTRSMTGHDDDVMCLHLLAQVMIAPLLEQRIILEVTAPRYDHPVVHIFHLYHGPTGGLPLFTSSHQPPPFIYLSRFFQ